MTFVLYDEKPNESLLASMKAAKEYENGKKPYITLKQFMKSLNASLR